MADAWTNQLFYGDNLEVLREQIPDESVDLIYLDPPFNSQRNFNLLFKQVKGNDSPAQIMAFEDTWRWSPLLYKEFMDDMRNAKLFDLVDSLFKILGGSETMAYVVMMAPRLLELHKKLKPTGSLYLHCDPVASHYLKIILDVVFGPQNFRNEITWKRQTAHSDARHKFPNVADVLLFYAKSRATNFEPGYVEHDPEYVIKQYRHNDGDGRGLYGLGDLSSPNPHPNMMYEWQGFPSPPKGWRYQMSTMRQLHDEGRIHYPTSDDGTYNLEKRPRLKNYLHESKGSIVTNVWSDIGPVQGQSGENRGYPTQKPLALLDRVIAASSNEGDVVLDPFCGCGTAVVAAERMGRKWIGIDITWLAIAEVIYRIETETEAVQDRDYKVIGAPRDQLAARQFFEQTAPQNHKPFEMWGVSLVQGEPQEKKGADQGVDGRIPFRDRDDKLRWGLIQVKGGRTGSSHVRDFARTLDRDEALLGLFICFNSTKDMRQEAEKMGYAESLGGVRKVPRLQILTIKELLEEKKQFELPEGWRVPRSKGVGVAARSGQQGLDMD